MGEKISIVDKIPIVDEDAFFLNIDKGSINSIKFIEVIGRGGSCLVYKARIQQGNNERYVVIKEYYPDEENILFPVTYHREHAGMPLKILAKYEDDKKKELVCQHANIDREIYTNQRLYKVEDTQNNNPYIFHAWEAQLGEDYSDSSYIVIDTEEGETLKHAIRNKPQYRYTINESMIIISKILEVLDYMNEKGCVHGDVSLENIYLSGHGDNTQVKLLDFGSGFFLTDYRADIQDMDSVRAVADKIMMNSSLGSSHDEIRSSCAVDLERAKDQYRINNSERNAKELVEVINKWGIGVDLYAVVIVFFRMITGKRYTGVPSIGELGRLLNKPYNSILIKTLHHILTKNDDDKYAVVEDLKQDLQELCDIDKGEITPKSLILKLEEEREKVDFNPLLIPQIEIV